MGIGVLVAWLSGFIKSLDFWDSGLNKSMKLVVISKILLCFFKRCYCQYTHAHTHFDSELAGGWLESRATLSTSVFAFLSFSFFEDGIFFRAGIFFSNNIFLLQEYLQHLEEAKKYDHRLVGTKQELFFCHPLRYGRLFIS